MDLGGGVVASISIKGLDEYALRISKLYKDSEKILRQAVYAGAEVVADRIKEGIKGMPVDNRRGSETQMLNGVTSRQKADLIDGFGLAPIENWDGYIQTKAGFDGYGRTTSKKYPKGLPNTLLMRSVESGTSFRKKTPVIRKAVNGSRKQSVQAMGDVIDEACKETMK